jgi:hypothetical protein
MSDKGFSVLLRPFFDAEIIDCSKELMRAVCVQRMEQGRPHPALLKDF